MTHIVVKQTEADLEDWLATEAGFITGVMRYEDAPVVLEPYQLSLVANRSRFRWITKSRQVGYSFVFALEALARCHLCDSHTTVFVSFNQADAIEKILLQRRDVLLPRDRDLVAQVHSIKRRVLPSGKVTFDAERTERGGHADRFWAIALACQKERGPAPTRGVQIGVRVLG